MIARIFSYKTCKGSALGKQALLSLLLLVLPIAYAHASHFRGGSIAWQSSDLDNDGLRDDAVITVKTAWRRDNVNSASISFSPTGPTATLLSGNIVYVGGAETASDSDYAFQTQVFEALNFTIGTEYLANFSSGARITELQNNSNGSWNIQTVIQMANGNLAPNLEFPIIYEVPQLTANGSTLTDWTYDVDALDPNADSVRYRMANNEELGGGTSTNAAGLSIDPNSGLITWSGSGTRTVGLYSGGIVAEDIGTNGQVLSKSHVDFILDLKPLSELDIQTPSQISDSRTEYVDKGDATSFSFDQPNTEVVALGDAQGALVETSANQFTFTAGAIGSPVLPGVYPVTFEITDIADAYTNSYYSINFVVADPEAPGIVNFRDDRTPFVTPGTAIFIDNGQDAVVSDIDNTHFNGGSMKLNLTNSDYANETLSIASVGTGPGEISVSGSVVSYEGLPIGTIDSTLNGVNNVLAIAFDSTDATMDAVSALVRRLTYVNSSTIEDRDLTLQLQDSDGLSNFFNVFTQSPSADQSVMSASPARISANGTSQSVVTVALRDGAGRTLSSSGGSGAVTISTDAGTLSAVTDNGDGTYSAILTAPSAEGSANLTATLNGQNVGSSASVTFITPGVASGSVLSIADPSILFGSSTTATIQVAASGGGTKAEGGDTVTITSDLGTVSAVTDNGDGTYSATIIGTASGQATVSASVNGSAVPVTQPLTIEQGPAAASTSSLTLDRSSAVAGESVIATVQLRDAQGNAATQGGENVSITSSAGTLSTTTDNADGSYSATLSATVPGSITISAQLDSTQLNDEPTVVYAVGPADASQSPLSAQVSMLVSGESTTITLTSRDQFGNPLTTGGSTVIISSSTGQVSTPVVDQADGTYTASFTADLQGSTIVSATLGGQDASNTVQIVVQHGAPDASRTTVTPTAVTAVADGTTTAILNIALFDNAGNSLSTGGDTVAVSVDLGSIGTVVDLGNGSYQAVYTTPASLDDLTDTAAFTTVVNGNAAPAASINLTLDPEGDADNDGISNGDEGQTEDTDEDGTPDYRDEDSDNDGTPDATEGNIDTDDDGTPDYRDEDSDDDGTPDAVEGNIDTDEDGTPDYRDEDSDGDGTPDSVEGTVDTDEDGTPDYLDGDSDNDGTPDSIEGTIDTDEDGTPDYRDEDSDNDGTPDSVEGNIDTDEDGTPDYRDEDSDNDGTPDSVEGTVDTDEDGTPDYRDEDSDNDGTPDSVEGNVDTDEDGTPDYRDEDSDNDGTPDSVEGNVDTDEDGIPDYRDEDSDNDGTPDSDEGTGDTDGDGTPDSIDFDSDNDGIPDSEEGTIDTDEDGVANALDTDSDDDGIPDALEGVNDSDDDGAPDYLDRDSNGDGVEDGVNANLAQSDSDGDGIDDRFDVDNTGGVDENGDGVDDDITLEDLDGDGIPDIRDADIDGDGADNSEDTFPRDPNEVDDADSDGIGDNADTDDDNDGYTDATEEANGSDSQNAASLPEAFDSDGDLISDSLERQFDSDNDGIFDHLELDSDNDGIYDIIESRPDTIEARELDSNNDGMLDDTVVVSESDLLFTVMDTDTDGVQDYRDIDSDNDGILDQTESNPELLGLVQRTVNQSALNDAVAGVAPSRLIDIDNDAIENFRDIDSDNDGIPDLVEAGGLDSDGDGRMDDFIDLNNDGYSDNLVTTPLPVADSDGDGFRNFLDLDSDQDGLSDIIESAGEDADGNGRVDGFIDQDSDGQSDLLGAVTSLPDTDGDGFSNYLDIDSDGDGLSDLAEAGLVDENGDGILDAGYDADNDGLLDNVDVDVTGGIDADNDGIDDRFDASFQPGTDTDGDGVLDDFDADANGDGMIDNLPGNSPTLASALPDSDGDGEPDVTDENVDSVGVASQGCSINTGSGEVDWMMLLMMSMAGIGFAFSRLKRHRSANTRFRQRAVACSIAVPLLYLFSVQANSDNGVYIGAGANVSQLEPLTENTAFEVTEKSSGGFQGLLGYRFNPRWRLELEYADLGEAELMPTSTVAYADANASALFDIFSKFAFNHPKGVVLFARAGAGKVLEESDLIVHEESSVQPLFGLGVDLGLRPSLALRAEAINYSEDAKRAGLSLIYSFGQRERQSYKSDSGNRLSELEKPALTPQATNSTRKKTLSLPAATKTGPVVRTPTLLRGFDSRSRDPGDEGRIALRKLAQEAIRTRARVYINGYTDTSGPEPYNKVLSNRRAISVKRYLMSQGVEEAMISAKGQGPTDRFGDNSTPAGRRANRVVEVILEY